MNHPELLPNLKLQNKWPVIIFWVVIKCFIAYVLINQFSWGILAVVAYLIFMLENNSIHQHLNVQELNETFHKLFKKEPEDFSLLKSKILDLNQNISQLELSLIEMTLRLEELEGSRDFD